MSEPTPLSERQLAAQLAAHTSWSRTADRSARTAPARAGLNAKFERLVDPEMKLDPATRSRMAESAKKAHFTRMALKSAQVRRKKREIESLVEELESGVGGAA